MIGKQIGPYRILELLGKGGMGLVYLGLHTKLEQRVAIKILSPEFSRDASMRSRFEREARLQAKLSHPNVVNILNFLEDDENIYLVMEFVRGETLAERLQKGRLELHTCRDIALEVLEALRFMHRRGIVHRDVKPSNIILTEDGRAKVTDFGIAKTPDSKNLTKTGVQVGTVWYMSPEQIKGQRVDTSADIYALGVTLYQMVTGQVPFNSESEFEIMKAHVEQNPPLPMHLNPDITKALNRIILKALAKNPDKRIRSAEVFIEALQDIQLDQASVHRALPANILAEQPHDKEQARKNPRKAFNIIGLERFAPGRRVLYLAVGAGLLLVLLFIVLWWFAGNRKTPGKLPLTEKHAPSNQIQARKERPPPAQKKTAASAEPEAPPPPSRGKRAENEATAKALPANTGQLPPELMPSLGEITADMSKAPPAPPQQRKVGQTTPEKPAKSSAVPQRKVHGEQAQTLSAIEQTPVKPARDIPQAGLRTTKKVPAHREERAATIPQRRQKKPGPKTGGNGGWVIIK